MIHFEHIEYLWLLAGVALMGLLWVLMSWHEQQRQERWADREMWGRLIPDRRRWRPVTKGILTLLGMSLVVVALANPQLGKKEEKGKRTGSDIAVCIDVSNSMMAEDVKPNRLTRCKQVVNNLLNTMTGDRVSLIVFAGTSFIEMPLTNDYNAAKLFLEQVDCQMISTQGTAIGDAIEKAMATFGYGDEEREWKTTDSRAIIIISDGENHEDDAVGAAKNAYREGIRVCTIGLGSTQGTPIPSDRNGGFRRDSDGNVIITKLNEQMLKDIANAGKGVYVNGSSGVEDITSLLENLEKNEFDEAVFNSYESRYQYPLVAGLIFLLAEVIIFERRNKKWRMIFVFAFLFINPAQGQVASRMKSAVGNVLYCQKKYLGAAEQYSRALEDTTLSNEQRSKTLYNLGNCFFNLGREKGDIQTLETAEKCYTEALTLGDDSFRIHYNLGNTLYKQKKYLEAAESYNNALLYNDLTDGQRAKTMYNLGNSLFKETLSSLDTATLNTAISCYRNALRLDPKNADYRYNQTLAYRLLDRLTKRKNQPQQNQQQQQKKEQQKKEQKNEEKNNQQDDKQNQKSEQQKEQKKQNDTKNLSDEVKRELQRHQQNQQQQDQQQQKQQQNQQQQDQKQQNQQQGQKQQKQNQQNQKQQGQQQKDQQQNGQDGKQDQSQKSDQQKSQNPKQNNKKINDEIKKELERQKQGEKSDKKPEKKEGKGEQKQNQNPKQQNGKPQSGKPADKQQSPNTQQGTVLVGNKLDPNKKNAEHLLEAVKNNERKTIKTQIINAQPSKEYHSGKEW